MRRRPSPTTCPQHIRILLWVLSPMLLVSLLTALPAVTIAQSDAELAMHWAPVIFQDAVEFDLGRRDFLTAATGPASAAGVARGTTEGQGGLVADLFGAVVQGGQEGLLNVGLLRRTTAAHVRQVPDGLNLLFGEIGVGLDFGGRLDCRDFRLEVGRIGNPLERVLSLQAGVLALAVYGGIENLVYALGNTEEVPQRGGARHTGRLYGLGSSHPDRENHHSSQ